MKCSLLVAFSALVLAPSQLNAKWYEAKTTHFIVYSEQKPDELKDYATQLERYDGAIRAVRKAPDTASSSKRVTVYVLKTAADVGSLYGNGGVLGFYKAPASGPVAFINSEPARDPTGLDGQVVFFHEYLHHLMLQDPTITYPTWMSEGYAEFFSTAKIHNDGSVEFGDAPQWRGAELHNLEGMPLGRMLGTVYTQLTDDEFISMYSRGWLLTHFLAFEPSRRGQVDRYVAAIKAGMSPLDAARQSFGDLAQLDHDLHTYLKRKTLPSRTIPAAMIKVGTVDIRPLNDGEDAILKTRLRLEAAETKGEARYIAGSAHEVADRFPKSVIVLATLARAELEAEHFDEAIAAADRLLAVDPHSVQGLTYKAAAMIEKAKDNPGSAIWGTIRGYLAEANHLDPKAPEPLKFYYWSYVRQGVKPPAEAVDGLLGALELAPEDGDLRLMSVRQLLSDKDLKTARMLFGPIAFSPHSGSARRRDLEIMDRINSGDGAGALAMLNEDEKKREKYGDAASR
jgi:tetratricopeptide (TPR) repeat protein